MFKRREIIRAAIGIGAVMATGSTAFVQLAHARPADEFTLAKLPYAYDALEPVIDAETMTIHHGKHHAAYVTNLNKALTDFAPDFLSKPIEQIITNLDALPEKARTAVRNNGGGHWNHTFFWSVMIKPGTGGEPKGELLRAIEASFGGLDGFKKEFSAAATSRFGSGWAWLIPGKEKPLAVASSPNQDNSLMEGGPAPILGIDVWEHAYYLKYRNLRPKYIEEWFKVINWDAVAANYSAAKKK